MRTARNEEVRTESLASRRHAARRRRTASWQQAGGARNGVLGKERIVGNEEEALDGALGEEAVVHGEEAKRSKEGGLGEDRWRRCFFYLNRWRRRMYGLPKCCNDLRARWREVY